jgi:LysR family glycine cleavage system transcriptional activator
LYFALQAALDSLGIALAPLAIVADEVQRGRLCVLAQPEEPAVRKYALLWPRASARQAEASTLASWLREPGPA